MNSPATSTSLPPLEVNYEREGVGQELEATLNQLGDLSLIGKQLHWADVGPLFRPLHLQFDELVDSWRELADTVAERPSLSDSSRTIRRRRSRPGLGRPPSLQPPRGSPVLRELTHRIVEVSEQVRDRTNRLGDADLASQDVLIEVVRELERQQWVLRAEFGEHA